MTRSARSIHAPTIATAALLALGLAPSPRPLSALGDASPNRADAERMERGYYERILGGPRPAARPAPFDAGRLCEVVPDLREYVLKPGLRTEHRGASWSTNSLGMRDREYPTEKPPGVVRAALVGDSIGAGWGVGDGCSFEALMEGSLGRDAAFELLNFSVPGHAPGQRWEQFRRAGWPTSPDAVIVEATPADPGWDERRLRGLLPRGVGWDAPQYRGALAASGARRGGNLDSYKEALKPHRWAVLANVYANAVAECRARGVLSAWVLIPRVGRPIERDERDRLVALARSAGFDVVVDASASFDGIDPSDLAIAEDDFHPNARGHRILAEGIAAALAADPSWRALTEGRR